MNFDPQEFADEQKSKLKHVVLLIQKGAYQEAADLFIVLLIRIVPNEHHCTQLLSSVFRQKMVSILSHDPERAANIEGVWHMMKVLSLRVGTGDFDVDRLKPELN